ncbi:MAG: hypothetical protein Q9M89_01540 [Persephonella sp.]|nr:hypothetical protein [Persephonella sp.]
MSSTITTTALPVIKGFTETGGEYSMPDEDDILNAEKVIVVGNDISDVNPVITYLFHKNYSEGFETGKDKQIVFMGEKPLHINKFYPEVINRKIEEISINDIDTDEKTVIIYSTTTLKGEKAYSFGKLLGEIHKKTGAKVLILPQEANGIGLIKSLKLAYLPDVIKETKNGQIKNLILIGEDIVDHITDEELQEIFLKAENSIIITPFSDGLALSCSYAVGTTLWMEDNRTFEGFRGRVQTKSSITGGLTEEKIVQTITERDKRNSKSCKKRTKRYFFL